MINVVAAVIVNENGQILITQRNLKKVQGGLWEFPGGKIEPGESREEAIVREIKEELNVDIVIDKYISEREYSYPERTINLIALKCRIKEGILKLNEHEDAKWIFIKDFEKYNFASADEFIIDILKE